MRRCRSVAALVLAAALLTGCTGDGGTGSRPSATPSASASDPFAALRPPVSPGVGSFEGVYANRAYVAAQGLLALQLLERSTLLGTNDRELVTQLTGVEQQNAPVAAALARPSRAGLDYRPRLAPGVAPGAGTVTRSVYTADEVRGLAGEPALRVRWSGTVRYPVTLQGTAHTVTYGLDIGYVFGLIANEPGGLALLGTLQGTPTLEGVVTACADKGLLYPGPAGAACPV